MKYFPNVEQDALIKVKRILSLSYISCITDQNEFNDPACSWSTVFKDAHLKSGRYTLFSSGDE